MATVSLHPLGFFVITDAAVHTVNGTLNVTGAVDFDSTLNVDGAATFNALLRALGGFTTFVGSGKGEVLYETIAVAAIAIQLQMTRPLASTLVGGFWATVNMGGRIGTAIHAGTCRVFVHGRASATILFVNGPANMNITVTTVTQTTTDLTLKFAITGAAGTWAEFGASIVADSPVDADWTFVGSQVA